MFEYYKSNKMRSI